MLKIAFFGGDIIEEVFKMEEVVHIR